MRVQRLATAPVFAETLKVCGAIYLPHHWSDWPKILDLVLWVTKQHVYQVSLKSEMVGFNSLGDLTQNDPHTDYETFTSTSGTILPTMCQLLVRQVQYCQQCRARFCEYTVANAPKIVRMRLNKLPWSHFAIFFFFFFFFFRITIISLKESVSFLRTLKF